MPELKPYSISQLATYRQRIRMDAAYGFEYALLDEVSLQRLSRNIARVLGVPVMPVVESCRYLQQVTPTASELTRLGWRLAGNRARLQTGQPVYPWRGQAVDEWVPLQITRAVARRSSRGQPGALVTFTVLAGSPSGVLFTLFWSRKQYQYISLLLGFTRRRAGRKLNMPLQDPQQLVSLRLYGMLQAARSVEAPYFKQIRVPTTFKAYNQAILRLRYRIGQVCPRNFAHPCHSCYIGFEDCPGGTHRKTYVKRFCQTCQKEAYFDLGRSASRCVLCQRAVEEARESR